MDAKNTRGTVYFTALHLSHGGTERVITSLANAFCEAGRDVEILCTYRLGEPAYRLDERVRVRYLTSDRPNREEFRAAVRNRQPVALLREGVRAVFILLRKKATMRRALAAIKSGVVISTRHEHTLLLSKVGRRGVFKIAQLHSDHGFDQKLIRSMRRGYKNIDALPLFTEQTRAEVEGFFEGVRRHPTLSCLPHFLEDSYLVTAPEARAQVLAAGRLHPDKDFFSLIRIWKKVCETDGAHTLKIAGDGEQEAALKDYAKELGIADRVDFCGALRYEELMQEMAVSRAFALTSVSESFGLVLIEAMGCGTVPVAYDVRVGPRALITHEKDGFLVERGDEDGFAARLLELMNDRALRENMRKEALESAKQYYKEAVMQKWHALLSSGEKTC